MELMCGVFLDIYVFDNIGVLFLVSLGRRYLACCENITQLTPRYLLLLLCDIPSDVSGGNVTSCLQRAIEFLDPDKGEWTISRFMAIPTP